MTAPRLGMIWAQAQNGVIGRDGVMPWRVPEDMVHFKTVTMGHPVIMGRRTWESIPGRFRPLEGRRNIVVTRDPEWSDAGAEAARDPEAALALAGAVDSWVIGGGMIYAAFLDRADTLEVTEIEGDIEGDTLAPPIDDRWTIAAQSPWRVSTAGPRYRFVTHTRLAAH